MATKREKRTVITGVTEEQMNQAFADYARSKSKIEKINIELDLKNQRNREAVADDLLQLEKEKTQAFDVLQAYAMENRESLFSKKKSLETVHGVMGFRRGNLKLGKSKKYTWEGIIDLLKEHLPDFVRTKSEVNKEELIQAYSDKNEEVIALFPVCGITIEQNETFFAEPKSEN